MAERPVIIFPRPQVVDRRPVFGGGKKPHLPNVARQEQRLSPQFTALQRQFEEKAKLQLNPTGIAPEEVVVLETVGPLDEFVSAVRRISGMEWLAEWDEEEIAPDDDFFKDEENKDKLLSGRLFLVMTNQQAMQQLLSLWRLYIRKPEQDFPHGLAKFKDLFKQLREVRTWGVKDRLIENGTLEFWKSTLAYAENQNVHTEIELWFRQDPDSRTVSIARTPFSQVRNYRSDTKCDASETGSRHINRCKTATERQLPEGSANNRQSFAIQCPQHGP